MTPTPQTRLEILRTDAGFVPHLVEDGRLWASRGSDLLCRDALPDVDGPWRTVGRVPDPLWRRGAGRVGLLANALRLGVHGVARLRTGGFVVSVSGHLLRSDDGATWLPTLTFSGFRKPTRHGLLVARNGHVFCAEYPLNPDRNRPVRLWRSTDDGRSFAIVRTFEAGDIRHLHFIQQDPVDGSLWLGSGDGDRESGLWRSDDGGTGWQLVGRGDQRWRAIALGFLADAVVWGTDAGSDAGPWPNRVIRLERQSGRLDELDRLQGPVHGVTTTTSGDVLLATGVEGGRNETDRRVHLWHGKAGTAWREITSWNKGLQPRRVQYAVAHFPRGVADGDKVYVGLRGVAGMQIGLVEARIAARS